MSAGQAGGTTPRGAPRVVIAGGGLAGLAAATELAEHGVRVVVVEREPSPGGRIRGWERTLADGTHVEMDRGFHAFFRQYYNLRDLMRRVDPNLRRLDALADYPVLGPHGAWESFAGLPRRPPFNIAEVVRRSPTMRIRDLPRVSVGRALEMLSFDPDRTYARWDQSSAQAYLDSLRFPRAARRMLFEVFAHSFFNAEHELSAAELLMQFHFYFVGNPEGLVFDVMDRALGSGLVDPLVARLRGLGSEVWTGRRLVHVEAGSSRVQLQLDDGEEVTADAAVLALPVEPLRDVVRVSRTLGDSVWRTGVEQLAPARPFAVWRLWLDVPTAPGRAPFVGTAGVGWLDNISLYHLFQHESARWAKRTGGSVVELHAYGLPPDVTENEVRSELMRTLAELYPETCDANVVDDDLQLARDCPAFAPGSNATRPGVETPMPHVKLAGDFVRMPFPTALMERAVASGRTAARQLLSRWDVETDPLPSIPVRGPLARPVRNA